MKKLICVILLVVFASSCGNKFSLQKRRYNKGFYFANHHAVKAKENQSHASNQAHSNAKTKAEIVETVIVKCEEQQKPIMKAESVVKLHSLKTVLSHPLALKNNLQTIKKLGLINKQQFGKSELKYKAEKRGPVKKVIRIILGFIGGILLTWGIIAYLAAAVTGDPTAFLIAYALLGGAILCIVLAIVIKAS